ncbi:MAG TPA: hypothetical protein VN371_04120 [Chlorobaculum sp.]|nr:hypothetical protein [Chlorobaculum sp.]
MHTIHNDPHFLRISITGKVDQQSLYAAQRELMLHPDYPYMNSLWVFDAACECNFSSLIMFEMITRIKSFFPKHGTKKKTAIITSTNTFYSFVKLFCDEAELEGIPFTIKPFRTLHDAELWLTAGLTVRTRLNAVAAGA